MNKKYLLDNSKMTHEEIQKKISSKCDELKEFLLKKNEEYNDASFKTGILSNYARLKDKIDRYERVMKKNLMDEVVHFESLSDTVRDIAGYGIIGSIMLDELELLEEEHNGVSINQ